MDSIKHQHSDIENKASFWHDLQSEMLYSNYMLTKEDYNAIVEQNFMFSFFFRGLTQVEVTNFKVLYNLGETCYVILLQLIPEMKPGVYNNDLDGLALHHKLKKTLSGYSCAIGPLIANRMSILISIDKDKNADSIKHESLCVAKRLIETVKDTFSALACIGNEYNISNIYTSFIDSLACMPYAKPGQAIHRLDIDNINHSFNFDYDDAEKQMLDAIRQKKTEAYDYFGLLMNHIKPMNDFVKRSKVLELLVLASHTINSSNGYHNFLRHVDDVRVLKGDQIIEWAYQRLFYITGYVKQQNSIDYSNRIVLITREYLEAHYAEDITLEDIAEQVNISPQYFSKLIKRNTGLNFIDWLSMLRVKKARELLSDPNLTVKEVCFMVGYKDPNYFSRIFKKRMGITPSEYVKSKQYPNTIG